MSPLLRTGLAVPDLDRPWREVDYCVVDVEATGLDLRHDTLVSFASVVVSHGRVRLSSRVSLDISPGRAMSHGAVAVHGLRDQDVADAPALSSVAGTIAAELDGRVLVAHAAWVERAFLREPLRLARRRWRPAVVDTAALLRATGLAPHGTGYEPDIEEAAERLGLCVHTPHQALGDALTTAEVFLVMAVRLEREHPGLTARDLVGLSREHTSR